jgi:hypothetical protein
MENSSSRAGTSILPFTQWARDQLDRKAFHVCSKSKSLYLLQILTFDLDIIKRLWLFIITLTVETIYNSYSLLLLRTVAANTPTKCRSHLLRSSLFHSQFHMNGPPRKAEALLSYEWNSIKAIGDNDEMSMDISHIKEIAHSSFSIKSWKAWID